MGNLFNVDNGFFTFMGKFWDMMAVSIMWTLCAALSIFNVLQIKQFGILYLVIAIPASALLGPATTALYYAVVKSIRRDRGYVSKEFFHSFKSNFKVGAVASFIYFFVSFILYIDFSYSRYVLQKGGIMGNIMVAVFIAISIIAFLMVTWSFPILSRFTLGVKQLMKTTFLIAIRHFLTSIAAMVLVVIALLATYMIPILLIIVPALLCFICSFLYERVFKKYMPKPEGTPEETGEDQWYWE